MLLPAWPLSIDTSLNRLSILLGDEHRYEYSAILPAEIMDDWDK
jgi:hypothetical protein